MQTEGAVQGVHSVFQHESKPLPGSHSLTPLFETPQSTLFHKAKLSLMDFGRKDKPSCQKFQQKNAALGAWTNKTTHFGNNLLPARSHQ